jgi:hypothetical protein
MGSIVRLPQGYWFDRQMAVINHRLAGVTHGCFPEIDSVSPIILVELTVWWFPRNNGQSANNAMNILQRAKLIVPKGEFNIRVILPPNICSRPI